MSKATNESAMEARKSFAKASGRATALLIRSLVADDAMAATAADTAAYRRLLIERLNGFIEEAGGPSLLGASSALVLPTGFHVQVGEGERGEEVVVTCPSGNAITVSNRGRLADRILYELGKSLLDRTGAGGGEGRT